ncbi:MAG: glycosyltransferase family 39 protein, partial [Elusimicrobiota bacterium]|nr:glycosyltransferase family 39 protein [Endomicrobiia bacterium]MDW8166481.1 glycosyltransferase family 39 protein [Elusimicrobiota bacterium]
FIYILWHLYYLDKYPLPDMDDAWLTEPVWRLFKGKGYSSEMFKGVYGLEKSDVYHGRLYSIFHFPILIGGLSLYLARLSSLLSGFLLLFLTYLLAKELFNKQKALVSVIVLSLSQLFIILSHKVRQDMALCVFFVLVIYIFLKAVNKKSNILFFITGLLSSLAIDIHLNGVILLILIFILFIFFLIRGEYKRTILLNGSVYCIIGVIIGIFFWIYTHILIDPETFFIQWYSIVLRDFKPTLFKQINFLLVIKKIFFGWILSYWNTSYHRGMFEWMIIVLGIILSMFNRENFRGKKYIYLIIFTILITLPIFSHIPWNYFFFIYPFVSILIADTIFWFREKYKILELIPNLFFFIAILVNMLPISIRYSKVNYKNYVKKIKNFLQEEILFGDVPIWFEYEDKFYPHFSYYEYKKFTGKKLYDFLKEREVKYLVLAQEEFKITVEKFRPYFEDFLYIKKELIGEVEDSFFGGKFSYCPLHSSHITQIYKIIY